METAGSRLGQMHTTFIAQNHTGATGVIFRDQEGTSVGGGARWYEYCLATLWLEAQACVDGLKLARNLGASKVILETDYQELVNLWKM